MPPPSCALPGQSSVVNEHTSSQKLDRPPETPRLEIGSSPSPALDDISIPRRHVQMMQDLRSFMSFACRWLDPEDIKLVNDIPFRGGGFTKIWEATHDGRTVRLKSYCRYASPDFDAAEIVARLCNEIRVHDLLRSGGVNVVPLVGVYSTEKHPFGLIYEYMEGLDLKNHLKNKPGLTDLEKLNLLIGIAQCLERMHDLGIVHEELQTNNILVDKDGTPRIAGLGNGLILSDPASERRTVPDQYSRARAPELVDSEMSPDAASPTRCTKASDMYAFGVMAFEVLTGRPPFFNANKITAACSMIVNARRPSRLDHLEIPEPQWYIIERCWDNEPLKRMSAREALGLLQAEARRTSNLANDPVPT